MAYPLTGTLIDDFNRANGAIGSAYTALAGGFNVSSNQIVGTGTSNVVYRNDLTPPADCEAVLTVATLPSASGQGVRIGLRFNTTSFNGYQLLLYYTGSSYTWYIYRFTGGTPTQLGAAVTGQSMTAGDKIAFQLVGSTLVGYRYTGGAWAEVINRSDSTYTASGRLIIGTDGTVARLDDLTGGGATVAVVGVPASVGVGAAAAVVSADAGAVDATVTAVPASARLGAVAATVTGATVVNITVTALPAATRGGAARAAVSATPVTSVKLGIIGDSDLDEFRGDDNRGGSYASVTFSPTEMLVRVLGWNLGTWATRSEPRRTGYAQNWARSTATLGTVYAGSGGHSVTGDGQHTGLAAQITAGDVDAAAVIVGVNDFNLWNNTFQDVYNGTVAGANLTAKIDSILDNLETVLDALIAAGGKRILVSNYLDPVPLAVAAGYTDPTSQARVSNAITSVNAGIDGIIAARAACELFDRYHWENLVFDGYTRTPGTSFVVGGETITETVGDEPHNWILASSHFGTVFNGLFANAVIRAFNAGFGFSLSTMTDNQIIAEITGNATVAGAPASARAGSAAAVVTGSTVIDATVTGIPAQARLGTAAARVGSGASVTGLPAGARVGDAPAGVQAGVSVNGSPAGARVGSVGAVVSTGTSVSVAGVPAASRLGTVAAQMTADGNITGLPAAARPGAVGANVSTGVSADVQTLPAAARLGTVGAGIATGANIAGLPAAARTGAAGGIVSTGVSVTVTAAIARAGAGSAGASMSADVLIAALVAVVRLGAAGAVVRVSADLVTPPERTHVAARDERVHAAEDLSRVYRVPTSERTYEAED